MVCPSSQSSTEVRPSEVLLCVECGGRRAPWVRGRGDPEKE